MIAANGGHAETVGELIDGGADVNAITEVICSLINLLPSIVI